jgi:hypothetical protein
MSAWQLALRYGYGAGLLIMPAQLARLTRASLDHRTTTVARILGARELLQAELLRRYPSARCQLAGTGIDAVHSTSMGALAVIDARQRRLVLHSAATSAAFATASIAVARRPA